MPLIGNKAHQPGKFRFPQREFGRDPQLSARFSSNGSIAGLGCDLE